MKKPARKNIISVARAIKEANKPCRVYYNDYNNTIGLRLKSNSQYLLLTLDAIPTQKAFIAMVDAAMKSLESSESERQRIIQKFHFALLDEDLVMLTVLKADPTLNDVRSSVRAIKELIAKKRWGVGVPEDLIQVAAVDAYDTVLRRCTGNCLYELMSEREKYEDFINER